MVTLINSITRIYPQVEKTLHTDRAFSDKFNEEEDWSKIEILTAALYPIFINADKRNGTESFEEAYKHIVPLIEMRAHLYKESDRKLNETQ